MNTLLINLPETQQPPTYMPPLGLWKIRKELLRLGHRVRICDMHMGDDLEDALSHRYQHIGISARFSVQHENYLRVTARVSGLAFVSAGGIHAMHAGAVPGVDRICREPGEQYYRRLLTGDASIDHNDYLPPWFSYREISRYWNRYAPHDLSSMTDRWMSIETSRGCMGRCHYCGIGELWGKWKPYSLDYMDKQLVGLKRAGIRELFIEDDNVSWDKTRFLALIQLFIRYGFLWSCPNGIQVKTLLDPDVLNALVDSGCWRLSLPFETGSEESARLMGVRWKWIDRETAFELVVSLKSIGIETCGFFIIGYPGETRENVQTTLDYANSLPLNQRNIYIATPYPGTRLHDDCVREGWISGGYSDLTYKTGVISTPWLSAAEVERMKREDRERAIARRGK